LGGISHGGISGVPLARQSDGCYWVM
jgi:hypothetical protein